MKLTTLAVLICVAAQTAIVQVAHYSSHEISPGVSAPLPDIRLTPGVADPDAIADLSKASHIVDGIERNLCAPGFRTEPIRAKIVDFEGLKKKACAEYGVAKCDDSVEGDHLISLENGGCKDCLANLWPQPLNAARVVGYHTKDVVENRTHELICSGKITLAEGQKGLAQDWYQFAKDNGILPDEK